MDAKPRAATGRAPAVLLAEFASAGAVLHAAEKVRDAGYSRWDTHTPFPVHGMDRAMGLKDSRLGWIVIVCALTGLSAAFGMMDWTNGVDYPTVVGDKPPGVTASLLQEVPKAEGREGAPRKGFGPGSPGTLPSMVPILFELTILLSAFGAVFGMFGLNGLPRHNHPVFESERFRLASDDRFFISIEAGDPKFDVDKTRSLLEAAHASHVETIEEDVS